MTNATAVPVRWWTPGDWNGFFGLFTNVVLNVIVLGIFWKRTNKQGAIAGMSVGLAFTFIMIALMRAQNVIPGLDEPVIESFLGLSAQGIGVLGMASPMIQEVFGGRVGASAAAGFAAAMERQLRSLYPNDEPRPDLILLGIGEDGHTASLFPGTAALSEQKLLYAANWVPKLEVWRITATLPLLNAGRNVMYLVTGSEKAEAVRQALDPKPETLVMPASLVRPERGRLVWLMDNQAGKLLPHSG